MPLELDETVHSCGGYWSSDAVADPIGGQPSWWAVDFTSAAVYDEFADQALTRCVRTHLE